MYALVVFVPMFGDSFFTLCIKCRTTSNSHVFVPMFGDSFFTIALAKFPSVPNWFSSPCLGILLSREVLWLYQLVLSSCFRPHVWGFFFHRHLLQGDCGSRHCFRPHVWGFFFHSTVKSPQDRGQKGVFVPMFGDSFFTCRAEKTVGRHHETVFVPMFGDSFFTI